MLQLQMLARTLAVLVAISLTGFSQTVDSLDVIGKLHFHAERTFSPLALAGAAAYAGFLQKSDSPREWDQGAAGYSKRVGSTIAGSAIHSSLAFGLDSTLKQDPRYFRSGGTGFWRRSAHALRGTVLTRTDNGGETLSTWRIGRAYGAAYLSNLWYPDRELLGEVGGGRLKLPNDNFDVAKPRRPASKLTDRAYARLLHKLQGHYADLPHDLRTDILAFYQDLSLPIATKADESDWARLQDELNHLTAINRDMAKAGVSDVVARNRAEEQK